MFKRISTTVVFVLVALGLFSASAMAGGSEHCTTGGCQYQPATFVPGTTVSAGANSQSESSSESSAFSVKKTKKVIKIWESTNSRRVAVRTKPNGIKGSRGCMDPEKQGLIKAGDLFWNTDHGVPFLDVWQAGWKICHYRVVTINGKQYLKGTKKNCGNKGIKIPLHFKVKTTYKVVPSLEVKTYKEFWTKIWLKAQAESHSESGSSAGSTATTEGHYTCPSGWELVNGNTCKKCPPPHCEEPPEEPEHFVQVSCSPQEHIEVNDKSFMYCVATNDNGTLISLNVFGDSYATVGSQKSVDVRNEAGDPCPPGAQCFRETVTAGNTPGISHLTAIATSNGEKDEWKGETIIAPDDFGT